MAFDQDVPGVGKTEDHPAPQHTGFNAFARAIGSDCAAFPRRRSTWVILGIGAGGALLAHPVDDDALAHPVGSKACSRRLKPGHIVGSSAVQTGLWLGLYYSGHYLNHVVE